MIVKAIRQTFTVAKTIPSAKSYVERFASLQSTLKEQIKRVDDLQNQIKLASEAQAKTIGDSIKELISKISGMRHETRALKQQRQELIEHRRYLQQLISQSNLKWQQPREEIKKIRKQMSNQFLSNFVKLEENLLKNCSCETSPQLAEGLTLIHRLLISTITKHGVKFYEPQIGDDYDPELYDTLDQVSKGQKVKEVVSRGWKIDEKVVKKPVVRLIVM